MSGCRVQRRRLERLFDGSATLEERFAAEAHAADCARCAQELAVQGQLLEELSAVGEAPAERLNLNAAVAGIAARIDAQELPAGPVLPWVRPLRRVAAAAVLLVLGGAAFLALRASTGAATGATGDSAQPVAEAPLAQGPVESNPSDAAENAAGELRGPGQQMPPAVTPLVTDYDPARHDEARSLVAEELLAAVENQDPDAPGSADWVDSFDQAVRVLRQGERPWPVEALVAGLVREGEHEVARAAARALGRGCGRLARQSLIDALETPELARSVTLALVELGDDGLVGLQVAFHDPALRPLVLGAFAELDPSTRADVGYTLARADLEDAQSAGAVVELLASSGEDGARALLELAQWQGFDEDLALAGFGRCAAAPVLLAELSEHRRHEALVLAALRSTAQPALLPWLTERARRSRLRADVADALASYADVQALEALLALEARRGVSGERFLAAWSRALDHGPESPRALAKRLIDLQRIDDAEQLLELLAAAGHPAGIPALGALVGAAELDDDSRREAAASLVELGDPRAVGALVRAFEAAGRRESRLAAELCLATYTLGGDAALSALLDGLPTRAQEGVRGALEGDATRRSRLYRIARELEPVLNDRTPRTTETSL